MLQISMDTGVNFNYLQRLGNRIPAMFQRLGEAMTEKLVHIAVEDGKTKAAC